MTVVLNRYHKSGGVTHNELTPADAIARFAIEVPYLLHHCSNTFRLTVTDPLAGNRVLLDSYDAQDRS